MKTPGAFESLTCPNCAFPKAGPPIPPIATRGPYPQATALPSHPLPPSSPHTLALFAMFREGVAQAGAGES